MPARVHGDLLLDRHQRRHMDARMSCHDEQLRARSRTHEPGYLSQSTSESSNWPRRATRSVYNIKTCEKYENVGDEYDDSRKR